MFLKKRKCEQEQTSVQVFLFLFGIIIIYSHKYFPATFDWLHFWEPKYPPNKNSCLIAVPFQPGWASFLCVGLLWGGGGMCVQTPSFCTVIFTDMILAAEEIYRHRYSLMAFERTLCLYAFLFPPVSSQRAWKVFNLCEGNEGEKASELSAGAYTTSSDWTPRYE